jgi:hypothetical protein
MEVFGMPAHITSELLLLICMSEEVHVDASSPHQRKDDPFLSGIYMPARKALCGGFHKDSMRATAESTT